MTDEEIKKLGVFIDSRLGEFRDEIKGSISVSEKNLRDKLGNSISASEKSLQQEISASENKIVKDLVNFVSDQLIPIIDEKADKTDIDRLERKLDFYIDGSLDLKTRVGDIESLPTVAHELKVKRKRKT